MESLILKHNNRASAKLKELEDGDLDMVAGGAWPRCPNGQDADITVHGGPNGGPATADC